MVAESALIEIRTRDGSQVIVSSAWVHEAGCEAKRSVRITVEHALYATFIVVAALTRFWDLGSRALHHDESLHAYYSWLLATGEGYRHHPLMHGPFLFEANALVYLLFGDSDASARYLPALAGVLLVAAPWLLRSPQLLGRFGALAASFMLLVSPTFLYYTRYIRHDAYTALGALLFFTCIVRYKEAPARRWLLGGAASLAFLLTNHEIIFALGAVFVGFIWATLLWGRLRPLLAIQFAAIALAGAAIILVRRFDSEPLPVIPWSNPTRDAEAQYYQDLVTHPMILTLAGILVVFVVACWWTLADERRRRGEGILEGTPPGSTEAMVLAMGRDSTGIAIALLLGIGTFATLFTTFFTNLEGLASGTIATDGTLLLLARSAGCATRRPAVVLFPPPHAPIRSPRVDPRPDRLSHDDLAGWTITIDPHSCLPKTLLPAVLDRLARCDLSRPLVRGREDALAGDPHHPARDHAWRDRRRRSRPLVAIAPVGRSD